MQTLFKNLFTPLESPAIYGGGRIDKILIPHRKGGVKAPSFLTGFTLVYRKGIAFSLILPCGVSYTTPQGPRFLPLYIRNILNWNISKKNRSNAIPFLSLF
jgi:hypothetical protein